MMVLAISKKSAAHIARRDPHDRILSGIVGGGPAEELNADGPLFQRIELLVERSLHNVKQELCTAAAALECFTLHNEAKVFSQGNSIFVGANSYP
jgi:hypothetical protein